MSREKQNALTMKNYLKLFAAILLIAFTTQSYAQSFGVKAGLNLSNMVIKNDDDSMDDIKMNLGFNLGVTAEFPITDLFSFETGLMLNTKGFKINEKDELLGETIELNIKTNIFYLDIPLTAKIGFDAGGTKIYALAGPYVGFALMGKVKGEVTYMGETETESENVEFGSDDDQAKRLDYGLLIGAGAEFGKISVGATYGLGMANMSNYSDNGYKENHRVISISLGYKF
jgi:hypothetical protein